MPQGPSSSSDVAAFRQFNRAYTKLIGTLDEGLLRTEYSLAEARIIYELATAGKRKANEIAGTLGLDPGYLSRMLSKFENSGLIHRRIPKEDSRSAEIYLTRKGRAAFETLNALSDEQARAILQRLAPADRTELIHSMKTIQRVLATEEHPAPNVLRPHRPGDMGWVVHREGA